MRLTQRDAEEMRAYWAGLDLALDDLANGSLDWYKANNPTFQMGYDDMKACFDHETKTMSQVYQIMQDMLVGAPHNLRFKYEGRMDWVVPSEQPKKVKRGRR